MKKNVQILGFVLILTLLTLGNIGMVNAKEKEEKEEKIDFCHVSQVESDDGKIFEDSPSWDSHENHDGDFIIIDEEDRENCESLIVEEVYACNDGIDNDEDGLIDMEDSGCESETDDDEVNYPYGIITNPTDGSTVEGEISLTAEYYDGDDENDDIVQWAIRKGTCAAGKNTVFGNVDGFKSPFSWDGNLFEALFDSNLFEDGKYCFIFNPKDDGKIDVRETSEFTIEKKVEIVYACNDGIDNDDDGLVDMNDPGCESETDDDETNVVEEEVYACNDGIDNDEDGLIDMEDSGCESETDDDETNVVVVKNAEEEVEDSSSNIGGRRRSIVSNNGGEVLGASTDTETNTCGIYLNSYMKTGGDNDPEEVKRLQTFLNGQGYIMPVTGYFGSITNENVKKFQIQYREDILTPWIQFGFSDNPSGFVFKLTRYKINNMVCPGSEAYPVLS